jgi:hypothetical protein
MRYWVLDTANHGSSPFSPHHTEYDISFYSPRVIEATVWDLGGQLRDAKQELKNAQEEKEVRGSRRHASYRINQGSLPDDI